MNFQSFLKTELDSLKEEFLYRQMPILSGSNGRTIGIDGKEFINFSSNDYLGFASDETLIHEVFDRAKSYGVGSGASRLVSGNLEIHEKLEKELAAFKNEEAALIFSSGFMANLGIIASVMTHSDVILMDRLNHASLIDAARLSKAKLMVYQHLDLDDLKRVLGRCTKETKKLVVTDAYFSMDGDVAPLDAMVAICQESGAILMVDEAHSTGVFGKNGRGLVEHFGCAGKIDMVMGTLSKALGSVGGFVVGSHLLREYLVNHARSLIYTTGPSPLAVQVARCALERLKKNPQRRLDLWEKCAWIRRELGRAGWDLFHSQGPIIPVLIGEAQKTLKAQNFLKSQGIFVPAIRPPTVALGTERLRLSISACHQDQDLQRLAAAMKTLKETTG